MLDSYFWNSYKNINSLANEKKLNLAKLRAFADNKFNVIQTLDHLSYCKKHCGEKERIEFLTEKHLTLYHTILTFNEPGKEAFRKHCGKRIKCW